MTGHPPLDRAAGGQEAAPPPSAPGWARRADAAVVCLLGGALAAAVLGRSLLVGPGTIPLPAPAALLAAAAIVFGVRHAACRRPAIGETLAGWGRRLDRRPHLAAALRAFVLTRALVFVVSYFAVVTFGMATPGFVISEDPLANLPARFDAGWYAGIALNGYSWDGQFERQRNIAFFPALPMLMRPVGLALGMRADGLPRDRRLLRALWAGVIVSLIAFAWALYYLSRLAGLLAGEPAAMSAPLLLAAYPFAAFFNAPYTEGVFLLGSVGAFYHFHQRRWGLASLFGLIAGFSRPNGCLVSIPLAVLAVEQAWRAGLFRAAAPDLGRFLGVRLVVASMPGVAMLLFTIYLYWMTGVWLAWLRMQAAWGREAGTRPLAQGWEWLTTEGLMPVLKGVPFDTLNTLAVLFALGATWVVFRRLGLAYTVFVLVNLVPPVFAGGALSMGRVTSTLFPIFIALAATVKPRSLPGWVCAFAMLQGLVAALFFTWRELF